MDWQFLVVILCVVVAVSYLGRKMYRSMRRGGGGCGCGCSCGEDRSRRGPSCCQTGDDSRDR